MTPEALQKPRFSLIADARKQRNQKEKAEEILQAARALLRHSSRVRLFVFDLRKEPGMTCMFERGSS